MSPVHSGIEVREVASAALVQQFDMPKALFICQVVSRSAVVIAARRTLA